MSELKTCGDIIAEARRVIENNGSQEEILVLARQMGLIACPGCRAKFKQLLSSSGIDVALLDKAINEGLADPNRDAAVLEKMKVEAVRYVERTAKNKK